MKLEPVCTMELAYDAHGMRSVRPFGGDEGTGFGTGTGTVEGAALRGSARWSNHPQRRSDGVLLPDLAGVIETDDGAAIVLALRGRIDWYPGPAGTRLGSEILAGTLSTDDPRYSWVNDALFVADGIIDPAALRLRLHVWRCVPEVGGD